MSAQTTAEPSPAAAAAAASQKGAAGGAKGSYVPPETHSFVVSGTRFEVEKKYKLIKPIGHGAYGVVVACEDTTTGEKVAIKKIPHAFDDLVDAKRILREIKLLQHFCHENVISIIDIPVPKTVTEFEDVYIICTLMETDLHRIIYSKLDLSPEHVQDFVYQILRALKYMHR